ncbi:hypothetical protein HYX06_04535 [Candidatus Woesearchaeota archaeon]|nr:hypothetical protein [Candidatus Woesearchaeota archaeon]
MASGLEDIVNSKNEIKKTWLARKLNKPRGLVGKLFDFGVGLAGTAAAYSIIGIPALAAGGIAVAGDYLGNMVRGKKTTSSQIRDSLLLMSFLSPIGYSALNLINQYIPVDSPGNIVKRTLAQIGVFQGMIGPVANHMDYLIRHKTLNIGEAYENQFKRFFLKNVGWGAMAGMVPVSLDYLGYGVSEQFYGGLTANIATRGLVLGRQIAATDPYGTYRISSQYPSFSPQYA